MTEGSNIERPQNARFHQLNTHDIDSTHFDQTCNRGSIRDVERVQRREQVAEPCKGDRDSLCRPYGAPSPRKRRSPRAGALGYPLSPLRGYHKRMLTGAKSY